MPSWWRNAQGAASRFPRPNVAVQTAVESEKLQWPRFNLALTAGRKFQRLRSLAQSAGDIPNVLRAISPAIEETKGQSGDPIENAVRANARDIAKHLQSAGPIIAPRVQSGEVKIVAAYYSLDTGQVELLK